MVVACPGIKADADRERTLRCGTKGGPTDVVAGGVVIRRLVPAVHGVRGPEYEGDAIQGAGSERLSSTPSGGVRAVGASDVVVSKVMADSSGLKCGVCGSRHRDGSDAEGTRVRADSRVRVES